MRLTRDRDTWKIEKAKAQALTDEIEASGWKVLVVPSAIGGQSSYQLISPYGEKIRNRTSPIHKDHPYDHGSYPAHNHALTSGQNHVKEILKAKAQTQGGESND